MNSEVEYLQKRLRRIFDMKQESVESVRNEQPSEYRADNLMYLIGQFDLLSILAQSTDGLEDITAELRVLCKELYALRMENSDAMYEKTRPNA